MSLGKIFWKIKGPTFLGEQLGIRYRYKADATECVAGPNLNRRNKMAATKTAPTAKAPKTKTKTETAPKDRKLSKTQVAILKTLAKAPAGLTRAAISEKTKTFIGSSALGQSDSKKLVETSLLARGYVKLQALEEGQIWTITAAGKKGLASAD